MIRTLASVPADAKTISWRQWQLDQAKDLCNLYWIFGPKPKPKAEKVLVPRAAVVKPGLWTPEEKE